MGRTLRRKGEEAEKPLPQESFLLEEAEGDPVEAPAEGPSFPLNDNEEEEGEVR